MANTKATSRPCTSTLIVPAKNTVSEEDNDSSCDIDTTIEWISNTRKTTTDSAIQRAWISEAVDWLLKYPTESCGVAARIFGCKSRSVEKAYQQSLNLN